jgi:hypothetical protein
MNGRNRFESPDPTPQRTPKSRAKPLQDEFPSWDADLERLQTGKGLTRCLAEVALLRHKGMSETRALVLFVERALRD